MKRLLILLLLAPLSPAFGGEVEDACEELVLNYAWYRDRMDADGFGSIFSRDARLEVLGEVFEGRDAIRQRLIDGKDGPMTRHLMSTIRIFPEDSDTARGVSYVTVYIAPRGDLPRALEDDPAIGEYHDRFERTAEGWKIADRRFVPVFMNQGDE